MALLYRLLSPVPNLTGTYGGALWAIQELVNGDTYFNVNARLSPDIQRNKLNISATFSQDTLVSAILDGVGRKVTFMAESVRVNKWKPLP